MAQHSVQIKQMPEVEVLHKDMVMSVDADGEAFGRLTISKGGVGWYSKNAKKERHLSWERLDRIICREFGELD